MFKPQRMTVALLFAAVVMVPLVRTQEASQADPRQWKIAFDSERDGNRDIYVMDADGSGIRRLTVTTGRGRMSWGPKWSPDKALIAFFSNRDGESVEGRADEYEIYVMDADGRNLRRLTHNESVDREPGWSPDGSKIAFVSNRDGNYEIYAMDVDGSNVRRLTHHPADDAAPRWSPDGNRIAFSSRRETPRQFDIYIMNADGSAIRRLSERGMGPAHWSPDGRKIASDSSSNGNWDVYVMDADGSNVRRLTDHPKADARPRWSRDGTKILFHSTRHGASEIELEDGSEYEIYIMDADGSNVRRLTFNKVFDGHPDW